MKFKLEKNFIYSLTVFLLGIVATDLIYSRVRNFDKYHWLILAPIVFPLIAVVFGVISIRKSHGLWKMLPIIFVLLDLAFAGIISLAYSFSYWQF